MRTLPSLILLLLHATPAAADDGQVWLAADASVAVDSRTDLELETVARFGNRNDALYEAEFGGWITRDLGEGVSLSLGYLSVPGYSPGRRTRIEDRPRQQIAFGLGRLGRARISGRVRIEQRVRNTGSDLGVRVRPRIKVTHPLGRRAAELVASHEGFFELNDTDWGQNAGFRRMRNFVGVALPIAKRVGIEIGYLNQYDFVDCGPDRVAHVGSLSVSFGF